MKLPYAGEIQDARAQSEEAQRAVMFYKRVQTAAHAVSILQGQIARGIHSTNELPGDDELAEAQHLLPQLVNLDQDVPGSINTRLNDRAERLQRVLMALSPLVERADAIAVHLHELQHQQHHELEKPEWTDQVAALNVIAKRRDAHAKEMALVMEQLAKVSPVANLLLRFVPQLEEQVLIATTELDEDGAKSWRAARLAQQQLINMALLFNNLKLVVPLAFEPQIPDQHHLRHRTRLLGETEAMLVWMRRTADHFLERQDQLQQILEGVRTGHINAEDELKERMG